MVFFAILHSLAILQHCLVLSYDMLFLLPQALSVNHYFELVSETQPFPIAVCFVLSQAAAEADTHRVKPSPLPVPIFTVGWQLSQLPTEAKCLRRERE